MKKFKLDEQENINERYENLEAEEKVEIIKELAKPIEMSMEEGEKMLEDMDEYTDALEIDIRDKRALLKSMKEGDMKESIKAEITELEEQLEGLREFSKKEKGKGSRLFIRSKENK